ncbi:hypothetical protein HPP92_010771 [Vanilla planifolia]|uniref:NAC domain-containing protein n=1 Tax=Vanilla planifolia TaxID=51239 RepID=A0A835RA43_VANPL|nr:hypothetical protein HPP92_010771 [Vanilla planifolia]
MQLEQDPSQILKPRGGGERGVGGGWAALHHDGGEVASGFQFHPRDDELVCDYLEKKIVLSGNGGGEDESFPGCPRMIDVDLNKCEPWDLPEMACVGGKEWYFFSLKDRKYATGQRTNRATRSGYWKATGKDRPVVRKGVLSGMRKTLVFYQGRAPKGKKTDWVMHEFRREADPPKFSSKEDWVLCRVFFKSRSTTLKQVPTTMTAKEAADSFRDHGGTSSLPPLADSYTSFGGRMGLEDYEQVPCFSTALSRHPPPVQPENQTCGLPADAGAWLMGPLVNGDMKVLRAVLTQLTKMEGGQKRETAMSLGEGGVESYFGHGTALTNVWWGGC